MVSRRAVLAGGAAATAATAVGGCSTYGTPSATPAKTSHGPVTLGPISEIPVGGGKVFASHQVVVTQPKHGEIKCFTAVCTHEGCLVDSVTGGTINCPCHGSQYNMATGKVVRGPAPRALAAETITVTDGTITLA